MAMMIFFSSLTTSSLFDNISLLIFFTALAVIITWIAYLRNFFSLPFKDFEGPKVRLFDCLAIFLLFIACYQVFAPLIIEFLFHYTKIENRAAILSISQIVIFLCAVFFLILYSTLYQKKKTILSIWKDREFPLSKSIYQDIGIGVLAWVIAMPMVIASSYLAQTFTDFIFGVSEKEQLAVRYLKLSLSSPYALFTALFSILIAAPIIEEYLFRGILQSWLRTKLHPIKAITASSFIFALFHYSPDQSAMNITLLVTLFTFALYLGFVYEKTRSLWASIFLHVTFNFISAMRIINISIE